MAYRTERQVILKDDALDVHSGGYLKCAAVSADTATVYEFWDGAKGRRTLLTREDLEKLLEAMKGCQEEDAARAPEDDRQRFADIQF